MTESHRYTLQGSVGFENLREMSSEGLIELEHDDSDDEQREELEKERVHLDPTERANLTALEGAVDAVVNNEASKLIQNDVRSQITGKPLTTPDVGFADPTPSADLEEKKEAKATADEKVGEANEKSSQWTAARYLGLFATLAAVGGAAYLFIEYLAQKLSKDPNAGANLPPIPDDVKNTLNNLAEDWKSYTPEQYWTKFADEVQQHPGIYTLADQLVFMNITVKIGGSSGGFLWDRAQDESDMVDSLLKVYHDNKDSTEQMYRSAATKRYDDAEIPIVVMAEVLGLAFAWLGVKAAPSPT